MTSKYGRVKKGRKELFLAVGLSVCRRELSVAAYFTVCQDPCSARARRALPMARMSIAS
jgi:hypothetical protein